MTSVVVFSTSTRPLIPEILLFCSTMKLAPQTVNKTEVKSILLEFKQYYYHFFYLAELNELPSAITACVKFIKQNSLKFDHSQTNRKHLT